MKKLLSGLALIVATTLPNNSDAVIMDDGRRIVVYDRQNQRWMAPVSGKCDYKGLILDLSCDLEQSPGCIITETYDGSGKKLSGGFPEDFCLPKVVIQYPTILYCIDPQDCDKELMCC